MSWSYLPALGEEYTAVCYSDTLPSAPSRLSPRIENCCCNDSATACSRASLCGITCARSTGCRGEALSTSSLVDSPAPTSAQQAKVQESTASSPGYGERWRASFAKFDRDTCSWRTAQCSLLGDSDESSVIWPRSGMTVGGLAYPLPTVGRRTSGTGYGFWQTPVADDCVDRKMGKFNSRGEPKLSAQVKMVQTPRASDADKGGRGELLHYVKTGSPRGIQTPRANDAEKRGAIDATNPRNGLAGFVRLIPTQSATDWKCSSRDGQRRGQLTDPAMGVIPPGGLLNPEWVEWLQGWPIGSTAYSPLAMDRFREFMRQHGECCLADDRVSS